MPRLALIQAEIAQLSHSITELEEDNHFHPWHVEENAERIEKMRELLRSKQQQAHIIRNSHRSPDIIQNPHRQNAEVEEQDVSTIVYLMLVVAIVGVSVAMLMAAAGVLTQ